MRIEGAPGSKKVEYDIAEADGYEDIVEEGDIECNRCQKTWGGEKDLLDIGPPIEHRCTGCSWWGYQDFQHDLERPDCPGLVYRIDAESAEVAS